MEYAQLNHTPIKQTVQQKSLMDKCVEQSNKIKEEKEAEQKKYFFDPYVNVYNSLLISMTSPEYMEELGKKISDAMSDNKSRILFFRSNYTHTTNDTTIYIDKYVAQDIFTTTKYGATILIDALQEKLGGGFKVSWESNFIERIFRIYISWDLTQQGKCSIL